MGRDVRVSVVKAWLFADDDGRPSMTATISRHRAQYAQLMSAPTTDPLRLPWPPFRSNFWHRQLGSEQYRSIPPQQLVGALVPLRAVIPVSFDHPGSVSAPLAEIYVEPFGIWTSVTVDLIGVGDIDVPALAEVVDGALKTPVVVGETERASPLRDGLSPEDVLAHVGQDLWPGQRLTEAGTVRLLSSRIVADQCDDEAKRLHAGFQAPGNLDVHQLSQTKGAFAATSTRIGLALSDGAGAAARVKCLHHNQTLLVGHLLLFGAFARQEVPAEGQRYQDLAARMLNHLYRAEAIVVHDGGTPRTLGVYRSRIAPVWLDTNDLAPVIDRRTDASLDGPLPHLATPPRPGDP